MLAKPAANTTSAKRRSVVSIEHASGLGPLRSREREWTCTHFGHEQTVDLTFAVREPPRQAADALAVDDTVGNEAHRASDHVAARVPLGRSG